jgi:signal transduction histidine kinase/DNA-binding response OmpR family regulator/ligand-binding sensor domain-containing protein
VYTTNGRNRGGTIKQKIRFLGILVFGILILVSPNLNSQGRGFKYLKNYTPKEYDHNAQNWSIAQAKNGMIYVANQAGLLEYDGVSWRVIYIGENITARSLDIAEDGTVYVGGYNEIGYLKPDEKGALHFESLVHLLKEEHRSFSNVWSTHTTKDGVYFRTSNFLFRLEGTEKKKIKVWTTERNHRIRSAFICNGELWVLIYKQGLHKMADDSLHLLRGTETPDISLKNARIGLLAPYDETSDGRTLSWLIGVRDRGFFLYDGEALEAFPVENEAFVLSKGLYSGTRLSSGEFALATRRGGGLIMDRHGNITSHFDKISGLQSENVRYVFEDVQGSLWLCLDSGISRVDYSSPFTLYDERSGLTGLALSVVREGNTLYAGTTSGLYYREDANVFSRVPGISGVCFSLVSIDGSIFAASTSGIYQIKNGNVRDVIEERSYSLLVSAHSPGRIWCGMAGELVAIDRENGQLTTAHRINTENQQIRSMAEDINGNLWLGTLAGIVFNIRFDTAGKPFTVIRYDSRHRLPGGEITVAKIEGKVVFATQEGLFRLNPGGINFSPYLLAYKKEKNVDLESKPVFRIVEDKRKNIWLYSESKVYRLIPSDPGSYEIIFRPFRRIPWTAQVNYCYPDPGGKLMWFATHEGLISYDTTEKKNYMRQFHTLIRRISVDDVRYFDGWDGDLNESLPDFEYDDRNLLFEFAAPFFEEENSTLYQFFLEGYDDKWSNWNRDTKKNYMNLSPGRYRFRVRAKNVYGHVGNEAEFQFIILPPWYLTWWAYLVYAILLVVQLFLILKWRSHKLIHEKKRLEAIVNERTKEILQKNLQLERQTLRLVEQAEKLSEMDKVKSRFFANISHEFRTPLVLIIGPLDNMLSRDRDKKEKKTIKMVLRNAQRLLTLINQLLDLSRIDSGKMKLQVARHNIVSFLKGIIASFEIPAREKGLELGFQAGEDGIYINFDAEKMEIVMANLLTNALKFTHPNGKITVTVSREINNVDISVKDTGIGIPRENLARIFDRFFQVGDFKGKGHKGTGIGLALANEIILLHHGTIDVHSQEGLGTEFVIGLPLGTDHFAPDKIVETHEEPFDASDKKGFYNLYPNGDDEVDIGELVPVTEEKETGTTEKPIILVIEDNADVRQYIRKPLGEEGFTVIEAGDGSEGIKKARKFMPDLIVSDIMMPELDGYEMCEALKKDIITSHIPIILLTAKASDESILHGLETGADDYVIKPFSTTILIARVKNLIDQRQQLKLKMQNQKTPQPSGISVSPVDEQFLRALQDTVEEHLSEPDIDIDTLCENLGIGSNDLSVKIKALTGETPEQYILSYRLEKAVQLLNADFGGVTDVAFEVGFPSTADFARSFKEKFQQLPTSYLDREVPGEK